MCGSLLHNESVYVLSLSLFLIFFFFVSVSPPLDEIIWQKKRRRVCVLNGGDICFHKEHKERSSFLLLYVHIYPTFLFLTQLLTECLLNTYTLSVCFSISRAGQPPSVAAMVKKNAITYLYMLLTYSLLSLLNTSAEDDLQCLQAFKSSVSDPAGLLSNWNFQNISRGTICSFNGVDCWNAAENKVLSLEMSMASLSGSFPSGLNLCASIQTLDLSANDFVNAIPEDICTQMPYLTNLDLSKNKFSGPIPEGLSNCTYLNSLKLSQNELNGIIPYQIGLLPRLTTLDLSSNNLRGPIPSSLSNRSAIGQQSFSFSSSSFPSRLHLFGSTHILLLSLMMPLVIHGCIL